MKLFLHPTTLPHIEAVKVRPYGSILLHGPTGVGKTTTAKQIAAHVVSAQPDIIVVEPDEKGTIGIQTVHQLHHDLMYQSFQPGARRVAIIDQAEKLTQPAQNALLKLLEEPPQETVIVLTANNPTALLDTILSRCRSIYVPLLPIEDVAAAVAERFNLAPEEAHHLAVLGNGAVATSLRLASDTDQQLRHQEVDQQLRKITGGDLFERLQGAAELAAKSGDLDDYVHRLTTHTHQHLRTVEDPSPRPLEALRRLKERLRSNVTPRAALEAYVIEAAA